MAELLELSAKLKVLSDSYAAQLPEKLAQLEQEWRNLPADEWDDEGFLSLHRMVHSLTGSGKTFGFSGLSNSARELENTLEQFVRAKEVLTESQRNYIETAIADLRSIASQRDL